MDNSKEQPMEKNVPKCDDCDAILDDDEISGGIGLCFDCESEYYNNIKLY